jgi:hypothetical protein
MYLISREATGEGKAVLQSECVLFTRSDWRAALVYILTILSAVFLPVPPLLRGPELMEDISTILISQLTAASQTRPVGVAKSKVIGTRVAEDHLFKCTPDEGWDI